MPPAKSKTKTARVSAHRKALGGLREIVVRFDVYNASELVCVVGPWADYLCYRDWYFGDKLPAEERTRPEPLGFYEFRLEHRRPPLIWLRRLPRRTNDRANATLAHECLHAVRFILEDVIGLGPLSKETDEAYCHMLGHAIRTITSAGK